MSEKKYLEFIAEFLIILVLTLPFYTASVYATINSVSVKGSSGIENLVKTKDNLNFDVQVSIQGNSTVTSKQLVLGSNLSFDSCSSSANGLMACKLKFPGSGDFTFGYDLFPYSIRLYKSNGALDDTKSGVVLIDRKGPNLQISVPKNQFSSGDNITIVYDAVDTACSDAQCAGKCSGIDNLDFASTNGSFRQAVDVPDNTTNCEIKSSIGIPAKNFGDGMFTISAYAAD